MPVVKFASARVVTASSVVRVDLTMFWMEPSVARMMSMITFIATLADMLFSETQRFAVIVPEIVTSADTGGLMNSLRRLPDASSTPGVVPVTVFALAVRSDDPADVDRNNGCQPTAEPIRFALFVPRC